MPAVFCFLRQVFRYNIHIMNRPFNSTAYRYNNEHVILALTFLLVVLVIAVTATATVCMSVVFILGIVVLGYFSTRAMHKNLLQRAELVTPASVPGLVPVIEQSAARLQVEPVNVFIANSASLNAYTFGMSSPKAIVLNSALFQVMDRDELQFILGHEMGHVRLGHTWLNSLVGGMAGIPSSSGSGAILELAFMWWNRACELSADLAGMLACGKPHKAISALVKIEAGPASPSKASLERALQRIEAQDDDIMNNLGELFATHPMIIKRIEQIRRYATTLEYRNLQTKMDGNL